MAGHNRNPNPPKKLRFHAEATRRHLRIQSSPVVVLMSVRLGPLHLHGYYYRPTGSWAVNLGWRTAPGET